MIPCASDHEQGPNDRRRRLSAAFTLVEVMVVVMIISIIVSSVLLSVDISGSQKTRTVVSSIQLLMRGLANEAILEGDHYGLRYDRARQQLIPVVEKNGQWSAYSSRGGERPDFKPVSWKGFAEAEVSVAGTIIDERHRDTDNFYSGKEKEDQKHARKNRLVEFWPTGMWDPAGEIRFFVSGTPYATIKWTVAGRLSFEHGDAP